MTARLPGAGAISVVPSAGLAATNLQAALEEIAAEASARDSEVTTAVGGEATARDAAIATHAGLADPHPGYLTPAEGTAAYSALGHGHTLDFGEVGDVVASAFADTAAAGATGEIADAGHRHAREANPVTAHEAAGDPHTGYRLESADHSHASTGLQAGQVAHSALSGITANDHHAQAHAAAHLPTGADPADKFSQSGIGTADLAIANTETVIVSKVFAANELAAGMTFMFKAFATRAGTTSASPIIRIRIGTTTLIGNIAATLTPPVNTLAVGNEIEGIVTIRSAGAGGTALGSLKHTVHLAAVTITEALGVSTATVAVNTTSANQRIELTFISGNAANTYTWRNAVMYRVA